MIGIMRIGIGLPAAVPEADMAQIGSCAAQAEQAGFESVGVVDRLVYDNLDPLVALAAAAACTSRIRLISTVVNVNWRTMAALQSCAGAQEGSCPGTTAISHHCRASSGPSCHTCLPPASPVCGTLPCATATM
jgi:hypothetical protein